MAASRPFVIVRSVNADIRWQQRFENFEKALLLLRDPLADIKQLTALENLGSIKQFEFTFELGWKTLKDYLEHAGIVIQPVAPRNVIKEAFAAGIIKDGQVWVDMLENRNRMAHTYDETILNESVAQIAERYLPALNDAYGFLKLKSA